MTLLAYLAWKTDFLIFKVSVTLIWMHSLVSAENACKGSIGKKSKGTGICKIMSDLKSWGSHCWKIDWDNEELLWAIFPTWFFPLNALTWAHPASQTHTAETPAVRQHKTSQRCFSSSLMEPTRNIALHQWVMKFVLHLLFISTCNMKQV